MTSAARNKSNKENARKSTGPRTVEGKAKSASNALNHGMLSKDLLLPGEDVADWSVLLDRLMSELAPVGTLEQLLVERIAVAVWRQRRLVRVETARIQVAQRPDTAQRMQVRRLVGEDNPVLVEQIVGGEGEAFRRRLYQELIRARNAGVRSLDMLAADYPLVWQRLQAHAKAEGGALQFIAKRYNDNLDAYLAAMQQSHENILAAYELVALDKAAFGLPAAPELMSRYQSALDNDLYKAMRALREAQRFRRESLEAVALSDPDD